MQINLSGKNYKSARGTVPSTMNTARHIAGEKIIPAASSAPVASADYNLSKAVAANVSVDASLSLPGSSAPTTSAGEVAEQNNSSTVQPIAGATEYATSGTPASQSSSSETFYQASGGSLVSQSSSAAGFSSSSPATSSTYSSLGSEATSPTSSSVSSADPSSSDSTSPTPSTQPSSEVESHVAVPVSIANQTNLNITDFGASADAVKFFVNTVSNSYVVSVAGTNTFTTNDIGKVIEVFGAGPWVTYSNWGPVVTQQDIICSITNVTDGTNLTLTIPCGWTMTATCVVGTNNAPAFQAAIDEASNLVSSAGYTNVTINIPGGTYLLVSAYVMYPPYVMYSISDSHPAIRISSGGITLMGDPSGDTVLLGCGAGMEHQVGSSLTWISAGYAPYVPMRDSMIWCAGPVQNNQLPLVFQNLTLDGGVQQGAQSYTYWTIIQGNGEGWDTTHHAIADWDGDVSYQMNMSKVFTNCVFQHWRGEMLICWTGVIPGAFNDIANCTFYDGNATADNMYYGQHIHGCTFNQIEKVTEFYQYNGTVPTVLEDNLITNINGHCVVLNGATTNAIPPSFTIRNNTFYGSYGEDDILFTPACNVVVSNNQFYGASSTGISFSAAGLQPADGSAAVMSNFVIVANNFNNTYLPIVTDGYPVQNVIVANNVQSSGQNFALGGAGWKTNWFFSNNTSPATIDSSSVQAGSYFVDDPSDNLGWYTYNDYSGGTNWVTYGHGLRQLIIHAMSNSVFAFNSNTNLLIPGDEIQLDNMSSVALPVYTTLATADQSNNNNNNNNNNGGGDNSGGNNNGGDNNNNNPPNNSNTNQTSVVTLQTLDQLYNSNAPINTFFQALYSTWFPQSGNSSSGVITSAPNVTTPEVVAQSVNVPDSSPAPITLAAGQTLTFVWDGGVWQEE